MKKTSTKLQLRKSTIRLLHDGALAGVRGGGDAYYQTPRMPTNQVVVCCHGDNGNGNGNDGNGNNGNDGNGNNGN